MTGNYSLLLNVQSLCSSSSSVKLPNGNHLSVSGKGSVVISDNLTLHNVLYVPNFHFNLLSISKFTKSHNCCVTFYPHYCTFQDLKSGKTIWIGKERQGLYFLSTSLFQPSLIQVSPQCNTFISCTSVNNDLWHQRLGHMSISRMHMLPFLSQNLSLTHCKVCPKSKQTRLSFPKASLSNTSSLFELIHMDIWGPFRIPTYNGERYFLTIVDDFSRGTWAYLMQSKMDILRILNQFFANDCYSILFES